MRKIPSWAYAQIKASKPQQFSYNTKFGQVGNIDRKLMFVPMWDYNQRLNENTINNPLGTGAGYLTVPVTTESQWPCMLMESPQLLFSWRANNTIDSSLEYLTKYLWGPRYYEWEFTNFEVIPIEINIFWCKPRRDLDYSTVVLNTTTYDNFQQGPDLNEVLYRCHIRDSIYAQQGTQPSVSGLRGSLPQGWSPFQSTSWCQLFRCVKTTKFRLDAGQCAKVKKKINSYTSISDLTMADVEYVATRRTIIPFITVLGCPVFDSTSYNKVGTGVVKFGMTFKCRFKWWSIDAANQRMVRVDLPPPAGAVTAGNATYVSKPIAQDVNAA